MPPNHIVADLSSFQTSALYTATQQVTNNISEANQHPKKKKTLTFTLKSGQTLHLILRLYF